MQFDVNINATLEVDDEDFEHLVDQYDEYEGWSIEDLYDAEVSKDDRAQARKDAREEALAELASDIEGAEIDSYNGRAWVCSVDLEEM